MILACLGPLLCLQSAVAGDLQAFALHCVQARAKTATVRILQFGDSHVAWPSVQRNYREVFQGQFGDGGPGFGLPWVKPVAGLSTHASSGWHRAPRAEGTGLLNTWFEAVRTGEVASLEGAFSHLRIHFQSLPGGGSARISVDGTFLEEVSLQGGTPELKVFERSLPGSRRLEVVTSRPGPVRMLGLSLEAPAGAVFSVMAANGRQAAWLLAVPEPLFEAQVKAEAPDLVILAFGTNEANDRLFEPERYRRDLEALLARFRKAAPAAALALVGPPDARLPKSSPGALDRVIAVQRDLAAHHSAFFWDQRHFMGGAGAVVGWNQSGHANRDLIHFTQDGYQRLAKAFLDRFFERLAQLMATGEAQRFLGQDPRWSKAVEGAFTVPFQPVRTRTPPQQAQTAGHPIYVFKTTDGRTIITDEPANVAGEQGDWVGRRPE